MKEDDEIIYVDINFLVGNSKKQSTDNVAIDPAKSYYPSLTCFRGLDKKT